MGPIRLQPTDIHFTADDRRVLALPHLPGDSGGSVGQTRLERLIRSVLGLPEDEVRTQVEGLSKRFSARHQGFEAMLERHAGMAQGYLGDDAVLSQERRLLLGAYLTKEYSLESASLSNPSMVAAPDADQAACVGGEVRFVLSLRAIGEGHISSIEFRCGTADAAGRVVLEPPTPYVAQGARTAPEYDRGPFQQKLAELGADETFVGVVIGELDDPFTYADLELARSVLEAKVGGSAAHNTDTMIRRLATSNYVTTFADSTDASERVLFPDNDTESRGMEDARFVRFTGDDGLVKYYATYTAYDGFTILPQLLSTFDFRTFRVSTLNGAGAQNKGMAVFPRKVGGRFVALSRIGGENISIMSSDTVHHWEGPKTLKAPEQAWELFQMGNCGSPLETEAGWVVLTHGVGPMRRYCLGAMLLDLEDPSRVLSSTPDPLVEPEDHDREGYVPNVLYSCGGMLHEGHLILPYGYADLGARICSIDVDDLLGVLTSPEARAAVS